MKISSFIRIFVRRVRRNKRKRTASSKHYLAHKEQARAFVHERLGVVNTQYQFHFGKVAIRDQRSRWGSCSAKGNLNFNYRLMFLPLPIADYVIAHELCHLKEFNHGVGFWELVEKGVPEYRARKAELLKVKMVRGGLF